MYKHFIMLIAFSLYFVSQSVAQTPQFVTSVTNSFGGSDFEEFFGGSQCLDGGYLLTGLTNSTNGDIFMPVILDTANIFVVKCDAQGNKEWAGTFGGNAYDKARYGIQDSDSNIVVVGTTHSDDGDITFTHGNSELFVLKLDKWGNKIWMKQYGGTGYESGRYIHQLNDGNYMIAGYTASNNFDVPPGNGGHDGWLMKLDTSGTIIWSQTYGGTGADRIRHFVQTPDGGLLFSGSTTSNDMDCPGNHGGTDVWIGKTDSVGNLQWSHNFGGSLEDYSYHVADIGNNEYLVTGYSESSDGTLTNHYGDKDGWILKVDLAGNLLDQKNFGGSEADRLYKCHLTPQGNIVTAGFTQSNDYNLNGIYYGQSKAYWFMFLDVNLNVQFSYTTGGSGADLGKELVYDSASGSIVIMGDSNSNDGNVLNNHGNFDYWIVKLDLFTDTNEIPGSDDWHFVYQQGNENLLFSSPVDLNIELEITDMSGRNIYRNSQLKIKKGISTIPVPALNKLASGIYSINAFSKNTSRRQKVALLKN